VNNAFSNFDFSSKDFMREIEELTDQIAYTLFLLSNDHFHPLLLKSVALYIALVTQNYHQFTS
jgi:hypothetical protein